MFMCWNNGVTVLGNGNAIFSGITTFNRGINIPFYKSIIIGSNTHGKIHYPIGGSALEIQFFGSD